MLGCLIIGGVIEEREKLFVQTSKHSPHDFVLTCVRKMKAIFTDRKRKTVTVRRNEDTYQESYDTFSISPVPPVRPPLPGIDLNGIIKKCIIRTD